MLSSLINLHKGFSRHPLTRNAPVRAWGRFAKWQIRSRLQEETLFAWLNGQRLAVRRGMTGATGNIYLGLHEFVDMMFVLHFLGEKDLFLDIGANIGSYTVLASGVRRSTTWAFEPDPTTAQHLARNIALNDLHRLVNVYECALGASRTEIRFTIGRDSMNQVANDDAIATQVVRQERLDDLIGAALPTMIKIDVEGYEEFVLAGAQNTLKRPSLQAIEIETVTHRVAQIMQDHNFEKAHYNPFTHELYSEPTGIPAANSLFLRDRPSVEAKLRTAPKVNVLGYLI